MKKPITIINQSSKNIYFDGSNMITYITNSNLTVTTYITCLYVKKLNHFMENTTNKCINCIQISQVLFFLLFICSC